jgi:hypothetical protein
MADYRPEGTTRQLPREAFTPPDRSEQLRAERGAVYGPPIDNHRRIAALWSTWLQTEVKPSDVAMLMFMVKQARLIQTRDHEDSLDDAEVYLDFYREFISLGE